MNVYLDGGAAIAHTLAAGAISKEFFMPLGSLCESFVVEFVATTSGSNPTIDIKNCFPYFSIRPGGNNLV